MNTETRGTLSRRGNISQITNAFVEEVNAVFSSALCTSPFSFAAFEYDPDELTFIRKAKAEMERLQGTTGLNKGGTFHPNAIHYSAVPWLVFTDMKHPTNMRSGDSVPKISTGKYFREGEKLMLPISVTCHHGLMDGYHVAKFIETLDL